MNYTIFETFVGAGGSHLGFKANGFISKYVNDFSVECIKTLLYNNPDIIETAYVDNTSIIDVDFESIAQKTSLKPKELDVLFGGIVCKGFSLAGERSPNDERNYFYHKQLEFVEKFLPKISIIENVPGIVNAKVLHESTPIELRNEVDRVWQELENSKGRKADFRKKSLDSNDLDNISIILRKRKEQIVKIIDENGYLVSVIDDILIRYDQLGYDVYMERLNSSAYGAATRRERIIIVAVRKDLNIKYTFPKPTHVDEYLLKKYPNLYNSKEKYLKTVTVMEAIKDLKIDPNDLDSLPMRHNQKTVERFMYVGQGQNMASLNESLPNELKISRFYSRGNTMRLREDTPSPTLVPGHSNFPIHPNEHRSITVREAACITGFPKDYKFFGNHTKRCEQVGNAVTPPLSEAIARSVKKVLDDYYFGN
jgi:DNA (cytosine-5)-methyltransferase 1